MKKLIVLVVALMAVGLLAYAQAPTVVATIAGYLDGGFRYDNAPNATGGAIDALYFNGNESEAQGGRMNLNMSWTYGDAGMKLRLRAQPYARNGAQVGTTGANNLDTIVGGVTGIGMVYDAAFVRRAWAFYNLFGGMVQINCGIFGIGDFATSIMGYTAFDNPDIGLIVFVNPIPGLEIGYMLPFQSQYRTLSDSFLMSSFGAKFSVPNVGTFQAWVKNVGADISSPKNLYGATGWNSDQGGRDVFADVNITAVKGLLLTAETAMVNIGDTVTTKATDIGVWVNGGYTIGALTIGGANWPWYDNAYPYVGGFDVTKTWQGLATFALFMDTPFGGTATTTWYVTPAVSYAINDVVSVGGDFQYRSNGSMYFDGWAKLVVGKNYIRLQPGYDTDLKGGMFTLNATLVSSF